MVTRRDVFKYVAAVPVMAVPFKEVVETKAVPYDEAYNRINKQVDGTYKFSKRWYPHNKDQWHL